MINIIKINNKQNMKLTPEQLKLCQDLGRIGGQSKSPRKLESCRINAAKARAAKQNPVKAKETALESNLEGK